jgi:hypothetical protein
MTIIPRVISSHAQKALFLFAWNIYASKENLDFVTHRDAVCSNVPILLVILQCTRISRSSTPDPSPLKILPKYAAGLVLSSRMINTDFVLLQPFSWHEDEENHETGINEGSQC